ncbi:MAG: prepilin peptidase [Candidatus Odinarchaeia archaeon]
MQINLLLDISRTVLVLLILVYACVMDLKYRIVKDSIWILGYTVGLFLTSISLVLDLTYIGVFFAGMILTFLIAVAMYKLNFIGGADVKAFMFITLTCYYVSDLFPLLRFGDVTLFSITTVLNFLLLTSCIPLVFLIINLVRKEYRCPEFHNVPFFKKVCIMLIGLKINPYRNKWIKHFRNLEDIKEDKLVFTIFSSKKAENRENFLEEDISSKVEALIAFKKRKGLPTTIWGAPIIPLLILIASAFLLTILVGDIILGLGKIIFQ